MLLDKKKSFNPFVRTVTVLSFAVLIIYPLQTKAQRRSSLQQILDSIEIANPTVRMYNAQIRSLNETAKGAKAWMAPELNSGFFMTPYNPSLWRKGSDGTPGMGQYLVAVQQTIPNRSRLNAEYQYMSTMSTVEREQKGAELNNLYAQGKTAYYEWVIMKKKLSVLDQNEIVLNFMIKNAEIRYKNGLGKISAYYKAKASLGSLYSMRLMLQNEIKQRRILLNTLKNTLDKNAEFDIDTSYTIKDYPTPLFDTASLISNRNDIRAIERQVDLTFLQQNLERARLKPEFGIRYEHMFGFGGAPNLYTLMGMVRLPFARWSARMNRANIEGLKWKAQSLDAQKQMLVNEYTGMAFRTKSEIDLKKKQIELYENNIIPALRRNYESMQLGYEQNTEELFMLFDAWETLNMTQLDYLDQLQQLLTMQAELEKILQIK